MSKQPQPSLLNDLMALLTGAACTVKKIFQSCTSCGDEKMESRMHRMNVPTRQEVDAIKHATTRLEKAYVAPAKATAHSTAAKVQHASASVKHKTAKKATNVTEKGKETGKKLVKKAEDKTEKTVGKAKDAVKKSGAPHGGSKKPTRTTAMKKRT